MNLYDRDELRQVSIMTDGSWFSTQGDMEGQGTAGWLLRLISDGVCCWCQLPPCSSWLLFCQMLHGTLLKVQSLVPEVFNLCWLLKLSSCGKLLYTKEHGCSLLRHSQLSQHSQIYGFTLKTVRRQQNHIKNLCCSCINCLLFPDAWKHGFCTNLKKLCRLTGFNTSGPRIAVQKLASWLTLAHSQLYWLM